MGTNQHLCFPPDILMRLYIGFSKLRDAVTWWHSAQQCLSSKEVIQPISAYIFHHKSWVPNTCSACYSCGHWNNRPLQNLTAKSKLHDPPCFIRFFYSWFASEGLMQIIFQSFVKPLQPKNRLFKIKCCNNLPLTCHPSTSSKVSITLKAHQLCNPLKDTKMPKNLLLTHLFGMFCPPHVIVTTYFPGVAG